MYEVVLLYILLCSFSLSTCSLASHILEVSSGKSTYGSIPANCQQPHPLNNRNVNDLIKKQLSKDSKYSVWLPVIRINLNSWIWLDGKEHAKRISSIEWTEPGRDCAVLRVKDKLIDDVQCNKTYPNIICDANGFKGCKAGAKCFTHLEKTYFIYKTEKSTWFGAKQFCAQQNLTLASFPTNDLALIKDRVAQEFSSWANAWIGLRLTEYYIQINNVTESLSQYFWDTKGPCPCPGMNCVIMSKSNAGYSWSPANCSERHHYLCIPEKPTYLIPTTALTNNNTKDNRNIDDKDRQSIIIAGILIPVFLLSATAIAVYLYRRNKQNNESNNKSKIPPEVSTEEGESHQPDNADGGNIPQQEADSAQREPLLERGESSTSPSSKPESIPPPVYSRDLPPNHHTAQSEPVAGPSGIQGAAAYVAEAPELPSKKNLSSSMDHGETAGARPQKGMSHDIWKTLTEALSRHLASHARKDELLESVKTFLKQGLTRSDKEIRVLMERKDLYNWETFSKQIELWRGSSPRDIAWTDLIQILTDEQYQMPEVADNLLQLSVKLKEAQH